MSQLILGHNGFLGVNGGLMDESDAPAYTPPWTPSTLQNLYAHYDFTTEDLTDQSGNGRDLTTAFGAPNIVYEPVASLAGGAFEYFEAQMHQLSPATGLTRDQTVLVAVNLFDGGSDNFNYFVSGWVSALNGRRGYQLAYNGASSPGRFYLITYGDNIGGGEFNFIYQLGNTAKPTGWTIWAFRLRGDGATDRIEIHLNGALQVSADYPAANYEVPEAIRIGNDVRGYIGEVIMVNEYLSDEDLASATAYLGRHNDVYTSPDENANLSVWYDFSEQVGALTDKQGNAPDLSEVLFGGSPVWEAAVSVDGNKGGYRFNAGKNFRTDWTPTSLHRTVIIAYKLDVATAGLAYMYREYNRGIGFYHQSTSLGFRNNGTTNSSFLTSTGYATPDSTIYIAASRIEPEDASNVRITHWVNGAQLRDQTIVITAADELPTYFHVGESVSGVMCEVLVFDAPLADNEVLFVSNYLDAKWKTA